MFLFFGVLIFLYFILLGGLFKAQNKFVLQGKPLSFNYNYKFSTPFSIEEIPLGDGISLKGIWFKTEQSKRKLVLYFHGNSLNLARWGKEGDYFLNQGWDFFTYDFRGYGHSGGKMTLKTFQQDAVKVLEWALQHYTPENILIYGRSLGCAGATSISWRHHFYGLILETPFNHLSCVFHKKAPGLYFNWMARDEISNVGGIEKTPCKVLILHGLKDGVVPYSCSVRLKAFLKPNDLFVTIPEGRHNNISTFAIYNTLMRGILN
jgi:uncharacterized protein